MPSSSETLAAPFAPVGLRLLVQVKLRALSNRVTEAITTAPVRFFATAACIALVWIGLYFLFYAVFEYLQQSPLEAAVAIPMVFSFFFAALLAMLTLSNAILAYMSLFLAPEAPYLLTAPIAPRSYVALKYVETLVFSSWSLVLLGLPLMIAMANISDEPWFYYPLFLVFFLGFVPIPGALGLLLAWATARFFSRALRRRLILAGALVVTLILIGFVQGVRVDSGEPNRWLSEVLLRLDFVHSALLPSAWVSRGVEHALQYRVGESLGYLSVTVANALFLSMIAVLFVAARFPVAFDRAASLRGGENRSTREPDGGVAGKVFAYLPWQMRLIAAKDLRTFARDPLQWTQLVILFGLMSLYLVNVPRFSATLEPLEGWGQIIPYLNFGAISFILATFTSRFVFPLVSLEGHQMWLVGMLPLTAGRLLLAKFAFAMTVSVSVAVSTTVLAATMLKMPPSWAVLQSTVMFAVCTGLCGLAVGIGARLPMFGERNSARIANGLGGTINLVASVSLILTMLAGMGWMGFRNVHRGFAGTVDRTSLMIAGGVAGIGFVTGALALLIGARHLKHREI
jgi:ABC-2 type transport system permease protein